MLASFNDCNDVYQHAVFSVTAPSLRRRCEKVENGKKLFQVSSPERDDACFVQRLEQVYINTQLSATAPSLRRRCEKGTYPNGQCDFKYRLLKGTMLASFNDCNECTSTRSFQPLHRPCGDGAGKERRMGDGARKWRRVRNFFKYRLLKGTMLV
ncbi:MAG: hypothetical protein EBR30_17810 [Cytophagia bacterium]|nr:hypothetical protein [Cytophagia bacterium]